MENEKLLQIGNEIAQLWGGSCYGYEIDSANETVNFQCIEHGERFVTDISFEELKSEHGFDIRDL